MGATLFLERRDARPTAGYIEQLKAEGLLAQEAKGCEFLGNSPTPEDKDTIKFYQTMMEMRPNKRLVQIPGQGMNLDGTPNNTTIYVAIDK